MLIAVCCGSGNILMVLMSVVEGRDYVLWAKHIHGNTLLRDHEPGGFGGSCIGRAATLILARPDTSPRQEEMPIAGSEARKLDYDRLRDDLKAAESTEVGFALIGEGQLNRSELERLARSLDLPVLRQDSVRRLEQKIVKALIGSRLNSRSVRGK
jgi:hypothetical protein